MTLAVRALLLNWSSVVYCAILGDNKMVANIHPAIVLAMPSLNLFNGYGLRCQRSCAMQDYLIYYPLILCHFALICFEGVLICS